HHLTRSSHPSRDAKTTGTTRQRGRAITDAHTTTHTAIKAHNRIQRRTDSRSVDRGLAVSGYLLNPLRSSEIEGWPGGAVVYVVESVVMLGWYGGWQAGVGGTPGMLLLRLRVPRPVRAGK